MSVCACISCPPRPAAGLPLSPGDHFQRPDVEEGLGEQLLQPAVFQFEILQALGIRHGHADELGPLGVERGITEAVSATQLLHRHTGFCLLQKV